MSANNAIFVIPIEWRTPGMVCDGKVAEWRTLERYLVMGGDVDMVGELTHTGLVTKELLWYAMQAAATLHESSRDAMEDATLFASEVVVLEYGIQMMPTLKYEEAWG